MTLFAQPAMGRRYQVRRPVGQGGFGTVYLADMLGDNGFVRAVALKVLNRDVAASGEVARRFRDEARVLGLLRHRAIVQVDGLVYLGDRQALVMEYIDGADLGRLMALGRIPPGPALEIVGEVANALDIAFHMNGPDGRELGLLHRDVKPSNIRLTPAGEVKVLDFGVARAQFEEREAITRSYLLGSNGYMGPERFEGEDGPPTDIYSLGVVLLEMLTGATFGSTSIRPQKLSARVEDALEAVGDVPGPVAKLVRQMMLFEPEERPTAADVERQAWELHRALQLGRLRDWARSAVPEAAAKPVPVGADDLSGKVLEESTGGATPAPMRDLAESPRAVDAPVADPSDVSAMVTSMVEAPRLPLVETVLNNRPPADEWDDEQPTVVSAVRGASSASGRGGTPNLAVSNAPMSFVPPPPVVPVSEHRAHERTPRPRPRPLPVPEVPQSNTMSRLVAVGTALGVILAGGIGLFLFAIQPPPTVQKKVPVVKVEAPPSEEPEKPMYDGAMPTSTQGAVVVAGDAPVVRIVAA
ncbi:MAG TPA: hypothetical protein DFR83_05090, partial [Deltaproteobacteria bacterium]|nr:hypothetical protein [Deltaproteobacteria bacterium]